MKSLEEKLLAAFEVEHRDHLDAARAMLDAFERARWERSALDLNELHRRLHSLKGAARAVDMRPVERLAHALEALIEDCQAGALDLEAHSTGTVRAALDAIEDWVGAALARQAPPPIDAIAGEIEARRARGRSAQSAQAAAPKGVRGAFGEEETPRTAVRDAMRVETRNFDALLRSASDILAAISVEHALATELNGVQAELRGLEHDLAARRKQERSGAVAAGAEARRGDSSARLQRIARRLRGAGNQQAANAWRMRQLGKRLQWQVELLRMISADTVFAGAGKIVRDLAREQGKAVRVSVKGLETLADRTVLQSLKDPVLHLLRNAVHHGIETPEERRQKGKPEEGSIALEVSAGAGELRLAVEDDGAGIAIGRVVAVARGKGLLGDGAAPAGEALTALLAQPGFSTVERVTEVAGRGMGLSVVKEAVARLGGVLTIAPRASAGVRVVIRTPLSVVAARFLVATVAGESWCFPANRVERVHRAPRRRFETLEGRAHLVFDDAPPMAIAPLALVLGRSGEGAGAGAATIVELQGEPRLGVVVDDLVAVRDGVMRDLGPDAPESALVAGGILLDSGIVAPVLDVAAVAAAAMSGERRWRALAEAAAPEPERRSILVVDDSITTRTLEKSILEASGYDVRLSVDGADALRQLRQQRADLVISDVEMPALDGFALVRAIKEDAALSSVPVILVTSRSDDADRKRGLDLGADAYVVKQRFDQTELLAIIGRLL